MMEICSICGELKFEVYTQDSVYYRCLCETTLEEVLKANGVNLDGDKNNE